MMGTAEVISALIVKANSQYNFKRVVDLGSGAGGAMPAVTKLLNNQQTDLNIQVLLTDLYPERSYIDQINKMNISKLNYHPESVDAANIQDAPVGLKTMINSFHHMPPIKARQILHAAAKNKQPLLIYELTENKIPLPVWWLFLPVSIVIMILMVVFMTPFVRPLTWKQLVFTYLIPLIPLAYAWDGQASNVRTYAINDYGELLKGIKVDGYIWKIAPAEKWNGKKLGYYVLGLPENDK
jgi:hypothetical protein